ncbi:hypothetical protein BGZ94_005000 [Podila epigama]|nr:hypothetical protein BGZ94_005000 [Podila epigama]
MESSNPQSPEKETSTQSPELESSHDPSVELETPPQPSMSTEPTSEKIEDSKKEKQRVRFKNRSDAKEASSYLNDAANQIDAQFEDVLENNNNNNNNTDLEVLLTISNSATSTTDAAARSSLSPEKALPTTKEKTSHNTAPAVNDDEWEWVEETEYVVIDFGAAKFASGMIAGSEFKLMNLDTPTPYLTSASHAFKGFYDDNAITEDLIFDMKAFNDEADSDSEDDNPALELVSIVTKRLILEHVANIRDVKEAVEKDEKPEVNWALREDAWDSKTSLTLNKVVKEATRSRVESMQKEKMASSGSQTASTIAADTV